MTPDGYELYVYLCEYCKGNGCPYCDLTGEPKQPPDGYRQPTDKEILCHYHGCSVRNGKTYHFGNCPELDVKEDWICSIPKT